MKTESAIFYILYQKKGRYNIMKKWETFTREELEEIVKNSTSIAQVMIKCGYAENSGGGTRAIKEMLNFYKFDTSHFFELNGISHNKGQYNYERFKNGNYLKPANMKDALITLRGHQCENCHNSVWLDKPIALEVHHLDGNTLNNELENLQLLCPNCHAQTENYRTRNNTEKEKRAEISEEEFREALESSPNIRQALLKLKLSPKGGNYTRANEIIAKYGIKMGG